MGNEQWAREVIYRGGIRRRDTEGGRKVMVPGLMKEDGVVELMFIVCRLVGRYVVVKVWVGWIGGGGI